MSSSYIYWNYLETKPDIYIKKQDVNKINIIVKNNKTKEMYETIINLDYYSSEYIDFNNIECFQAILLCGLKNELFENIK